MIVLFYLVRGRDLQMHHWKRNVYVKERRNKYRVYKCYRGLRSLNGTLPC